MKVTRVGNDFFVDGKETEFNNIDWKNVSESDFDQVMKGFNPVLKDRAAKKRGVKQNTQVAPVQVDPNSRLYETMAIPDDPNFVACTRNYAKG